MKSTHWETTAPGDLPPFPPLDKRAPTQPPVGRIAVPESKELPSPYGWLLFQQEFSRFHGVQHAE